MKKESALLHTIEALSKPIQPASTEDVAVIEAQLEVERKNGKELAAKLVDHLIVMGASVCHLNVEAEGVKYQVTVKSLG